METFTWAVDVGSGAEPEFRIKEAQFGNGYRQTVGDGLNNVSDNWNISIFGDIANVGPAYKFLLRHAGVKSFFWTTPLGDTIQVKGTELKLPSAGGTTYTLSAKFTQAFTPT